MRSLLTFFNRSRSGQNESMSSSSSRAPALNAAGSATSSIAVQEKEQLESSKENLFDRNLKAVPPITCSPRSLRQICFDYTICELIPSIIRQTSLEEAPIATIGQIANVMERLDVGDTELQILEVKRNITAFNCCVLEQLCSADGMICLEKSEELRKMKTQIDKQVCVIFCKILEDYTKYLEDLSARGLDRENSGKLFFEHVLLNQQDASYEGIGHSQLSIILRHGLSLSPLVDARDHPQEDKQFEILLKIVDQLERLYFDDAVYFLRKISGLGLSHINRAITNKIRHYRSAAESKKQMERLIKLQSFIKNKISALEIQREIFPNRVFS